MAPVPGNFLTNFAQFAPTGFIIDVSTTRDPLPLFVDKQVDLNRMSLPQQAGKIQTSIAVDGDNNPVQLTGGADQLQVQSLVQFNSNSTIDGGVKDGMVRAYTAKSLADQAPIDLSQLQDGNTYYLQRSFFISRSAGAFFPGRGYGTTLLLDDLPLDADWELDGDGKVKRGPGFRPSSYFVRIRAVTPNVKKLEDYKYRVDSVTLDQPQVILKYNSNDIFTSDFGDPSFPFEVSFPNEATNQFLLAVAEALILLVLSRSDVDVLLGEGSSELSYPPEDGMKDVEGVPVLSNWNSFVSKARRSTGLEDPARTLMPLLTGRRQTSKYFQRERIPPAKFRQRLKKAALNLANDLIAQNNPPNSLQQAVVARCQPLLNFTWGSALIEVPEVLADKSILDIVSEVTTVYGVALNQFSLGYGSDSQTLGAVQNIYQQQKSNNRLVPAPHFFRNPQAPTVANSSSVERAPVLYMRAGDGENPSYVEYVRNLIPDNVYEAAAFALRVAAGPVQRPQEQGWIAFRLFPQGLPDVDRFFDQLLALLQSIQAAVQGLADLINQYIEMLQSRILELQAFLNRINHIIQQLLNLFITIPPSSGLLVVANGTDGVLSALVNADNKPFDPPETLGGGVVILAGGLPTIALELFKALFSSGD
jgi:hypothetical protein